MTRRKLHAGRNLLKLDEDKEKKKTAGTEERAH